jgi:hypothetical protein
MNWPLFGSRSWKSSSGAQRRGRPKARRRVVRLEQLEGRALLAIGDLPFGAASDDTGEFMLGDVRVSVVLMESTAGDPDLPPGDNGTISYGGQPITYTPENWSQWGEGPLEDLRQRIEQGVTWWADTLDALPDVPDGLLSFSFDWTHFDTPVNTGYEPIARKSEDVSLWVYDFLRAVGHADTMNPFNDMKSWNNYQRTQQVGGDSSDWAFTIFVVNDLNDPDNRFHSLGQFPQAYSFAGGLFMVVPASRPAPTIAHETGHMFWGLDEYLDEDYDPITGQPIQLHDEWLKHRGYYNTQNFNAADNPDYYGPSRIGPQQPSIMSNDRSDNSNAMTTSFLTHTLAPSTREMLGWRDTDGDGIFDLLDKEFSLTGAGLYDAPSGEYRFSGSTSVKTYPNSNSYEGSIGQGNDITINQIRAVEFSIDGGSWVNYPLDLEPRTYQTDLDLVFDLTQLEPGPHTIGIRTVDTRTGVTSDEFVGSTVIPTFDADGAMGGFVFHDDNLNGEWDGGELPYPDFGLEILDESGEPVDLQREVEPDNYDPPTPLNTVPDVPGVTLTAVGSGVVAGGPVFSRDSSIANSAGNVFGTHTPVPPTQSNPNPPPMSVETWNSNTRRLKIAFDVPAGVVSIRAYKANLTTSMGRMEAYNAQGELLDRVTSGPIPGSGWVELSLSRPVADIAYVIVGGHAGTQVVLDALEWGPAASATTNALGAYSLAGYPPGTYLIRANPPLGYFVTTPIGGVATVDVSAGGSAGADFGIAREPDNYNPWHNYGNSLNVNGDSQNIISAIDALIIFNWINRHIGNPVLPPSGFTGENFVDVNNDGYCTAIDALMVFNQLNRQAAAGEAEGSQSASPTSRGFGGGQPAEGEVPGETAGSIGRMSIDTVARHRLPDLQIPNRVRVHLDDLPLIRSSVLLRLAARARSMEQAIDLIALDVSEAAARINARLIERLNRRG